MIEASMLNEYSSLPLPDCQLNGVKLAINKNGEEQE
jgi:hypothetical protein